MSYILDALRKADRERNLAKVPTLTTLHIPVYVTGRRVALWIVAVALLGGGVLAWFLLLSPRGASVSLVPVGAPTSVAVAPPADTGDVDSMSAPREVIGPPPAAATRTAPPRPTTGSRSEGRRQPGGEPAASPRASRSVPWQSRQSPPASIRPEMAETRPVELEPPAVPSPRPEAEPSVEASRIRSVVIPVVPPSVPPAPPTLRDALSKMTLDVFVYTDVEVDRMAVINGRRYVKGQFVDGLYLVESINPDGVVLTYQGERVVLRP
jgi:general secretion pathway protein B